MPNMKPPCFIVQKIWQRLSLGQTNKQTQTKVNSPIVATPTIQKLSLPGVVIIIYLVRTSNVTIKAWLVLALGLKKYRQKFGPNKIFIGQTKFLLANFENHWPSKKTIYA